MARFVNSHLSRSNHGLCHESLVKVLPKSGRESNQLCFLIEQTLPCPLQVLDLTILQQLVELHVLPPLVQLDQGALGPLVEHAPVSHLGDSEARSHPCDRVMQLARKESAQWQRHFKAFSEDQSFFPRVQLQTYSSDKGSCPTLHFKNRGYCYACDYQNIETRKLLKPCAGYFVKARMGPSHTNNIFNQDSTPETLHAQTAAMRRNRDRLCSTLTLFQMTCVEFTEFVAK